jgi:hypothetical protein
MLDPSNCGAEFHVYQESIDRGGFTRVTCFGQHHLKALQALQSS